MLVVLKEKEKFKTTGEKTQRALETVCELLLLGNNVVYITNELTFGEVLEKLEYICDDVPLFNLIIMQNTSKTDVKVVKGIAEFDVDTLFVVDTQKDVEDKIEKEGYVHNFYLYYLED